MGQDSKLSKLKRNHPNHPLDDESSTIPDLNSINVLLTNTRSIRNKTDRIKYLILDKNISICCITETWLSDSETSIIREFVPNTHEFHNSPRCERGVTTKGGGVGIVVSKALKRIRSVNHFFQTFECIELKFNHNNRDIIICLIYKPPRSSVRQFMTEFEDLLMRISLYSADVFFMGDFNI